MVGVYDRAKDFLIDYDVPLRPSLKNILELCECVSRGAFSYEHGKDVIKEAKAEEYVRNERAFTLFCKGKPIIFYSDDLSYEDKVFALCHEIGHIWLQHTYCGVLGYSDDEAIKNKQEHEANTFALCVLAPPPVLQRCRAKTINQIRQFTGLSEKHSAQVEVLAHDYNCCMLDGRLVKKYRGQIFRLALRKYRIWIYTGFAALLMMVIATGVVTCAGDNGKAVIPNDFTGSTMVYVTEYGHCYHLADCYHIKNSHVIALTKKDAQEQYYAPCKDCNP